MSGKNKKIKNSIDSLHSSTKLWFLEFLFLFFEIFNISINNLISVKAAKVLSIYEGKVVCWLCKRL
jgi:hypothetical protein